MDNRKETGNGKVRQWMEPEVNETGKFNEEKTIKISKAGYGITQ